MSTGDLWFSIIVIIVLILMIVLLIINAVYWNKLRSSGCGTAVSGSQANLYFWLNLIGAIIGAILLIWAIVRMFIRPKPDLEKLSRNISTSHPLEILPVGQEHTILQPQLASQPLATSQGYSGNIVSGVGVEEIHREAMFV